MTTRLRRHARNAIQYIYDNSIRPRLPRKLSVRNGVAVRDARLLDTTDTHHDYEQPCVDSIQTHTQPSDDVLIIGGGAGVTAVHAAHRANTVTVYEAARERVHGVQETARLNQCENIQVQQAVIGDPIDVWGTPTSTTTPVAELPECDVLEIDCEGAEKSILPHLEIRPRILIVEYHPMHDVTQAWTKHALEDLGYEITNHAIEVQDKAHVYTARYNDPTQ